MSPAVQPLLLFLLCRDLFNYALVTAGSVLDTAIDTADGRRADLYLFHDLVIGAAAKQQLCRFQPLCHIGDLLYCAQILKKSIALLPALKAQDGIEQCIYGLVFSGIFLSHCGLLCGKRRNF